MATITPRIIGFQALGAFFKYHGAPTEGPLPKGHQRTAQTLATVVGDLGYGYGRLSRQLKRVHNPQSVSTGTQRLIHFLERDDKKVANAIAAALQAEPELSDLDFLTEASVDPEIQAQIAKLFASAPERGASAVFTAVSVSDLAADLATLQKFGLLDLVVERAEITQELLSKKSQAQRVRDNLSGLLGTLQDGVRTKADAIQLSAEDKGLPLPLVNGVLGDTLAAYKSPLEIQMKLLGEPTTRKACILVHGLCDSEAAWQFVDNPEDNYGVRLRRDLGYDPLFLRYNTGLHISTNGQLLAAKMSELYARATEPIEEILLIGHSMGGLVIRSACHYAQQADAAWVKTVRKIFLLGSPHQGNDYEKIGSLASSILRAIPTPVTWGISALGNKRSAGIKDLRFGYLLDEDWEGHDTDAIFRNNRHPVPLLEGADHYIITATLASDDDNIFTQYFGTRYFGDGAVQVRSAMGQSFRKGHSIPFSPEHLITIKGLSHFGLLRDDQVYQQILRWLA